MGEKGCDMLYEGEEVKWRSVAILAFLICASSALADKEQKPFTDPDTNFNHNHDSDSDSFEAFSPGHRRTSMWFP